ncbi:virulence factor Mce family protein [Mycobacterium sp. CVI_P3]|uniref:Virulence factor Mce family protein n=1 Tax=Mycobacterium pinniadriaticum TaxID=2994102 RepID=A0ABT3SM34_9MYCO|nr:virulence factor Mce family protein [Mycobacterium pinniadriaticum]MCX2933997.1 virulence factor Mce family protein [Mycobacterium pinniadriaticum]MCX2940407.1 virulence factor Mce family protein [Mycobacterium pinniadriaticum]
MRWLVLGVLLLVAAGLSACEWRGLNALPLPGTEGGGPGSYEVMAQLPDVGYMEQNARVRVGDATVGNVTKIERQGWHALVTMKLNGDVELPVNATAKVGQTSLLGSLHVELAPPKDVPPQGKLRSGSLIPLSSGAAFPSTEQTLAALSLLLNGGGLGQIQDITAAFSTAFAGREQDLKSLITQLDQFITKLNDQSSDIIAATESLNNLVGKVAAQKPVLDKALRTIPDALSVLKDQRENLAQALDSFGKFSALATDTVNQTKDNLVKELQALGPVLESLANAGPDLTRSLSFLGTFPWPKETLTNWIRGDYANLTAIIDLTLSRIDSSLFTGTRWEGDLTELELQWGRTIGQLPSPYTAANPLVVPYQRDQGP